MAREQLSALLQMMQPARPAHATVLDAAKVAMIRFCNEWYTDITYSHGKEKKKLEEDDEYKAVTGLILNTIHGINSVRFLQQDTAKMLWRMIAASPSMFNFIHEASSYLSNQISTSDDKGWLTLVDEICRAESCISDTVPMEDTARTENLDILPNMTQVDELLKRQPWMVVAYVIYRCRFTQLFREVG